MCTQYLSSRMHKYEKPDLRFSFPLWQPTESELTRHIHILEQGKGDSFLKHTTRDWIKMGGMYESDSPGKQNGGSSKRTVFSKSQLKQLERRFTEQTFLCKEERAELAEQLGLSEKQIMIWFQNRRGRLKRRGPADLAYSKEKFKELHTRRPYPFLHALLSSAEHRITAPQGQPFHNVYGQILGIDPRSNQSPPINTKPSANSHQYLYESIAYNRNNRSPSQLSPNARTQESQQFLHSHRGPSGSPYYDLQSGSGLEGQFPSWNSAKVDTTGHYDKSQPQVHNERRAPCNSENQPSTSPSMAQEQNKILNDTSAHGVPVYGNTGTERSLAYPTPSYTPVNYVAAESPKSVTGNNGFSPISSSSESGNNSSTSPSAPTSIPNALCPQNVTISANHKYPSEKNQIPEGNTCAKWNTDNITNLNSISNPNGNIEDHYRQMPHCVQNNYSQYDSGYANFPPVSSIGTLPTYNPQSYYYGGIDISYSRPAMDSRETSNQHNAGMATHADTFPMAYDNYFSQMYRTGPTTSYSSTNTPHTSFFQGGASSMGAMGAGGLSHIQTQIDTGVGNSYQ